MGKFNLEQYDTPEDKKVLAKSKKTEKSKKTNLTKRFNVYFTEDEFTELEKQARALGLKVSPFVRLKLKEQGTI